MAKEKDVKNKDSQKPLEKRISYKKEIQEILQLTEQKVAEQFSDKSLDRELEKHKLLGGGEFSIKEIKDFIHGKARPYSPMFPLEYWRQMFRLFGWPEIEASVFHKKREAAVFNNQVIYGRFDRGVLLSLHVLNPYTGYMTRTYKHFQFMSDDGIEKLTVVIAQCIEMMKKCTSYVEFRKKWFEVYGVSYQLDFFE